ncbi:hypothetical protein B0H19DRAFT_1273623 [Mycena capillaripes]|nr:hypothetical protein B0H19DRAFT_1273623 [Mycena capillaripes]
MPYSAPSGHLDHQRSYTHPGAFSSGGHFARRRARFHLHAVDESSSEDEDVNHQALAAMRQTPPGPPCRCASPSAEPKPTPPRVQIFLADGTPLKSSFKSSRSAPHIHHHGRPSHHIRPRSPSAPDASSFFSSSSSSPSPPRGVHFPSPDNGLVDVRLFKQSARPAAVLFPPSEDTETETESELALRTDTRSANFHARRSPLNRQAETQPPGYILDAPGVPRQGDPSSMILLEALQIFPPHPSEPTSFADATIHNVAGTLLVRNAAYEKHVYVRFSHDGWHTSNDVQARYVGAGPTTPPFSEPGPGWDRFLFSIPLVGSEAPATPDPRVLLIAARFIAPHVAAGAVAPYAWCDASDPNPTAWVGSGAGGAGEWWDNNDGKDYRVMVRRASMSDSAAAAEGAPLSGASFLSVPVAKSSPHAQNTGAARLHWSWGATPSAPLAAEITDADVKINWLAHQRIPMLLTRTNNAVDSNGDTESPEEERPRRTQSPPTLRPISGVPPHADNYQSLVRRWCFAESADDSGLRVQRPSVIKI